jgi:hypothetical protein
VRFDEEKSLKNLLTNQPSCAIIVSERGRDPKRRKELRKMTKENAIRYYRKFSGADKYIIGFEYKKKNYMVILDEIMPRFTTIAHTTSNNGRKPKLQLNLRNEHKEYFIRRKGAIEIDYVQDHDNNGVGFERWVRTVYFKQKARKQDCVGFWVGGDIVADGIEYQVKFGNAQMVLFDTLHNLQACGKDWKSYEPKRGRKKVSKK